MSKKSLSGLLLVAICCITVFSCKKAPKSTADGTLNYFPLTFGKHIVYDVDSIYYFSANCSQYEIKSQQKYSVTDTFTDADGKLNYIIDVFSRPYDGAYWTPIRVITVRKAVIPPTSLPSPTITGLLYSQDNSQYIKMIFPIKDGDTWQGNQYVDVANPNFAYLKDWTYTYKNFHKSYNNGVVNFDNTVTVLENDEYVNYPNVDSNVAAHRLYAKEVYAYNVGMIYKEWTYTTYQPSTPKCLNGYTVTMKAIEYN